MGVRVVRHFAFVDLSGFSALTVSSGDERAVSVLTAFRALLRDICSRRGVRIDKWLGDGAMLVSVDPKALVATLLEAERAVGVARLPVPLRCGASSGEVILLEGDDYIGNIVNLAARLCDMAQGGEVLAGPGPAQHLPRWATVLSTAEMPVRGIGERVLVARLGFATLDPPTRPDPVCGIPLNREVAEERALDAYGDEVWLCSASCRETWERRPRPAAEGQGSLRTPLIGT